MASPLIFAGVEVSSERKPVTFTTLDRELNILRLEKWSISETLSCLQETERVSLIINSSAQKKDNRMLASFKRRIADLGEDTQLQVMITDAQKCFLALCGNELFARRTLEGRIQRALILYDEGLQIPDPMDFFEEITRHKLLRGILPLENIHTSKELDALVAAYMAWMTVHRPNQVTSNDNFILPAQE
jgi:hypothetical protein